MNENVLNRTLFILPDIELRVQFKAKSGKCELYVFRNMYLLHWVSTINDDPFTIQSDSCTGAEYVWIWLYVYDKRLHQSAPINVSKQQQTNRTNTEPDCNK